MSIKHKKIKNSGILYELLTRQVSTDLLDGRRPESLRILKKYFTGTELAKEYGIYKFLVDSVYLNEGVTVEQAMQQALESYRQIDHQKADLEKWRLIRDVKQHYRLDHFTAQDVPDYRKLATIYTFLIGNAESGSPVDAIQTRRQLVECLTEKPDDTRETDVLYESFKSQDPKTQWLTMSILLKKFNTKYSFLNGNQKELLGTYIKTLSDQKRFSTYFEEKARQASRMLSEVIDRTNDKALEIKLTEVSKSIIRERGTPRVGDDELVRLLTVYELLDELNNANH